jgi:hypothetical protein
VITCAWFHSHTHRSETLVIHDRDFTHSLPRQALPEIDAEQARIVLHHAPLLAAEPHLTTAGRPRTFAEGRHRFLSNPRRELHFPILAAAGIPVSGCRVGGFLRARQDTEKSKQKPDQDRSGGWQR